MSWSSQRRAKGISDKEFFTSDYDKKFVVVAHNSAGGFSGEFYAAIRNTETGEVFATCVVKRWHPRDYYNFSYKGMDECSGPGYYRASEEVLSALTPTTDDWANQWRSSVRERLDRLAQLSEGIVIKFTEPVTLSSGYSTDTFKVSKRRNLSYVNDAGVERKVKFPGWQELSFEVMI